jgi:hypothetical protein
MATAYNDSILPVEIFATGDWAGLTWTEKELDEIVKNFNELRDNIKPPVKLGHSSKQILAQEDGQPALGWVSGVKRNGNKLVAEFRDVPVILRELVQKGAYKRVSAEIYPRFERTVASRNLGKSDVKGCVLSAVAFVGADVPEVKTLEDLGKVLAVENLQFTETPEGAVLCTLTAAEPLSNKKNPPMTKDARTNVSKPNGVTVMPEQKQPENPTVDEGKVQFDELKALVTTLKADLDAQKAEKSKADEQIVRLTEQVAQANQRESAAMAARLASEALHFVEERSNKNNLKLMPSQREFARRLFTMLPDDVELITAKEATELKLFTEKESAHAMSPRECLKRLIDAYPGAEALTKELSLHTEAETKEETFEDALMKVMLTEKMDPANYDERVKATRLLIARNPSFRPVYGPQK